MSSLLVFVVAAAATLLTPLALAEGFLGIGPNTRLQDIRTLYPNARIADLKAAWLQPHQRLIDISGDGIEGQLAVKLEHELEGTRRLVKELFTLQAKGTIEDWQSWLLKELPGQIERLEARPPADPWEVKEIRWQPPVAVPLPTASRRYGAPDSDTTDEQFRRVVAWSQRGVTGYMNEAGRVELFVFAFTPRDYACAISRPKPPICNETEQPAPKPSQPSIKK